MTVYKSETIFARQNLKSQEYKDKINKFESQLHNLSDELKDAQVEYLQNNGYVLMTLDGIDILVSESLSFQELHSSLQKMPAPQDKKDGYALNYLVDSEDITNFRKSEKHNNIVQKRQKIINNIHSVYTKFWNEEVKPVSNTTQESIVYMMAGLDKNINADTLSSILELDKSVCLNYTFNNNNIVIKNN